jgi:hypothetical protein
MTFFENQFHFQKETAWLPWSFSILLFCNILLACISFLKTLSFMVSSDYLSFKPAEEIC